MLKKFLLFIVAVISLTYFCDSQTKGFRFQEILSDIPNDLKWDVINPENIQPQLQQKFHYLGSGEQSHAFLGEDKKTVLKFFRHSDLSLLKILRHLPTPCQTLFWKTRTYYDPRQVFDSCKIAYEILKDETGLHYLHINKTTDQFGSVTLIDNSGVSHTIDLDQTEFMVQDFCELATTRLNSQMRQGDLAAAQQTLKALFAAIEDWSRKGIHIDNPALKRNVGFCNDKVIMLDIGSVKKSSPPSTYNQLRHEIRHVMRGMNYWITKRHPTLAPAYQQELNKYPLASEDKAL